MTLFEKLGQFFDNLTIPSQIASVFEGIASIWETVPTPVRLTIMMLFTISCFLAMIKMLH